MSNSPFDGLSPAGIFRHFEALTRIPRGSGNEAGCAAHVRAFAEKNGFGFVQDAIGNVIVRVPGTAGCEQAPTVILQGHLDMVCEKDSTSTHDFTRDPIPVVRRGDYIGANGTSLGADNGVGVAAAMAIADDPEAVHGPLELLFTVNEETGLGGALDLDGGLLIGKTLLNLDSEEEGALYVGCAGGIDTLTHLPIERRPYSGKTLKVRVFGLTGGHSGLDINLGRGNAIQLLFQLLDDLRSEVGAEGFGLTELGGGDKHNAIPREAVAVIQVDTAAEAALEAVLVRTRAELVELFGRTDSGVQVQVEAVETSAQALTAKSLDRLLDLVLAVHHGVVGMSQAVTGLVETSNNLAVVRAQEDQVYIHLSSRSSVNAALRRQQRRLFALIRQAGAVPVSKVGYSGWAPNPESPVLARAKRLYVEVLGRTPHIKAIHAGLECGLLGQKVPGIDMISFGPTIEWPHSPSERLHIPSVGTFYTFLKALLADLARA